MIQLKRAPAAEDVLMPIGKYKGMPVEVALQDPQYCEWLAAQPWFRERFGNVYNIIINKGEPDDSPAHNALQALFLDEEYRVRFGLTVCPAIQRFSDETFAAQHLTDFISKVERHFRSKLASIEDRANSSAVRKASKWEMDRLKSDYDSCFKSLCAARAFVVPGRFLVSSAHVVLEEKGVDVRFEVTAGFDMDTQLDLYLGCRVREDFSIEIKPSIGEDYPAVLRQMRRSGARYLFLETYTGTQIDEARFRLYFESQGVHVVFKREVEDAPRPLTVPTDTQARLDAFDFPDFEELVDVGPCARFRAEVETRNAHLACVLDGALITVDGDEVLITLSPPNPVLERRLSEPLMRKVLESAAAAVVGPGPRIVVEQEVRP